MEVFEKLRCQLNEELDYIKMKMKQTKSKRGTSSALNEAEEEKRSGSTTSVEENLLSTKISGSMRRLNTAERLKWGDLKRGNEE